MSENMAVLDISNLSFSYDGKNNVLEDIKFSVNKGQFLVIVGPNGCGKTTLIKLIFDLLDNKEGEIKINGISNLDINAKKEIMYLPSDNILPEFLTGIEYLKLVCKMYDVKFNVKLLDNFTEYYSMNKAMIELIENYSHGMKKKLLLISSFLIQPNIIIIDETLNGIDLEAKEISKILLKKYITKGKTVIMCSHDLELAEEIGERVIMMYKGEIKSDLLIENIKKETTLTEIFKEIIKFEDFAYEI